jgi:uncharacterized membrane protein
MRNFDHPLKLSRTDVPSSLVPGSPVTATPVTGLLAQANVAVQRAATQARALLAKRQDHLWLSLVAVPLAMTAVALQYDLRLLIPIAILCWWWASSESQWLWLLGLVEGCFGIMWALLGATLLAEFPRNQIAVGIGWAAYALVVAIGGGVNRWRFAHKYGW